MLDIESITRVWADNAEVLNTLSRPVQESHYNDLIALIEHITDTATDLEAGLLTGLLELALCYAGDWEASQCSLPDATSPRDLLEFLMRQRGSTRSDLERAGMASGSVISQVLSGERTISRRMARKLADYFRVRSTLFL